MSSNDRSTPDLARESDPMLDVASPVLSPALLDEVRAHWHPERVGARLSSDDAGFADLLQRVAQAAARDKRAQRRARAEGVALFATGALALAASAFFSIAAGGGPGRAVQTRPVAMTTATFGGGGLSRELAVAARFVRSLGDTDVHSGTDGIVAGRHLGIDETVSLRGSGRAVFASTTDRERNTVWSLGAALDGQWVDPAFASVAIHHVQSALVLELGEGVIEVQVGTAVSGRESFAIDVGATRIAAKGTHFRVARHAHKVRVDLTEGVISIGPRLGFSGPLVSAPAAIELDIDHPEQLTVQHDGVRAPDSFETVVVPGTREPVASGAAPLLSGAHQNSAGVAAAAAASVAPPTPAGPAAPVVDPSELVLAGVRRCILQQGNALASTATVAVSVQSTLELDLNANGTVRGARFNPPLHPGAQDCAAAVIYQATFASAAQPQQLRFAVDVKSR
jgi:hypothetical protein